MLYGLWIDAGGIMADTSGQTGADTKNLQTQVSDYHGAYRLQDRSQERICREPFLF